MDNTSENNEADYKKDWRKSQLLAKRLLESKPAEKIVKQIKDKQIWSAFGGLTNFLSFLPTLLALNLYFFASTVVGNEFSKYIIKMNKWQIAVLALANLIFLLTTLFAIFFIIMTICFVSRGTVCPLSLWDMIKVLWDLI